MTRAEAVALAAELAGHGACQGLGCEVRELRTLTWPNRQGASLRIYFTGRPTGEHSFDVEASDADRVKAHWQGYAHHATKLGNDRVVR